MAVTQTQTLPAPFLESISKQYATGLGDIAKAPLPTAGANCCVANGAAVVAANCVA